MFEVREKPQLVERALLVGVYLDKAKEKEASSLLHELQELVETLGIGIVDSSLIRVRENFPSHLMGKGKMAEIIEKSKDLNCDCIIFDNELSPNQQRNWENESNILVIDRQEVILDIFSLRARTREARLQVQLAKMQYTLPRMARMWGHLDRQGGGSGGGKGGGGAARGEGEKQIEVDRRLARKKIDRVKAELEKVRQQRKTQRKERNRADLPHAAIVGYTNAGKSSLLNGLTESTVLAEDKLFATLDTTTRKLDLEDGQTILLTDTVGFVRRLPHGLVESFKATLEEAVIADFLIHVIDGSSENVQDHYKTTLEVLKELGADEKKIIPAINKIDLISDERLKELKNIFPEAVLISVKNRVGIDALLNKINEMLFNNIVRNSLKIPQSRQDLVALLHREGKILSQDYYENDIIINAIYSKRFLAKFAEFVMAENVQGPATGK
ncbi:MAG: GTPase HflX [Rickettsiales bacterium]|nr:GTPase HflX [Rickettsiales bacterium]|tara:strand:+ start:2220 stop:3545 length:1326 start_codon:yes stop_codon:yes gene_type:complete